MKKIIVVLCVLIASFLVSCNNSGDGEPPALYSVAFCDENGIPTSTFSTDEIVCCVLEIYDEDRDLESVEIKITEVGGTGRTDVMVTDMEGKMPSEYCEVIVFISLTSESIGKWILLFTCVDDAGNRSNSGGGIITITL